ncbi:MAG: insulinase family protein [Candidatus Hydrogenedentes bacterium]|nr:insulinase family protein [Candidatus Hydrogenedentota bacterium]
MKPRSILVLCAFVSSLVFAAFGEELPPVPVTRFTLDNGLEIWYLHRAESQSVAVSLVVCAGSRFEAPKQKGLSHFVEHACFEGTERYNEGQGKMVEIISARGGVWNAETREERTVFWAHMPVAEFETATEWLSQLAFHPTFPAEKMDKVRSVIFEEKGGKTPWIGRKLERIGLSGDITRDIEKTLFPGSPLAYPTIGEDRTLASITREDVLELHKTRYLPNNSVLIVVGAVERARLDSACNTFFAGVSQGPALVAPEAPALPMHAPRHAMVRRSAPGSPGTVILASRTVGGKDPDRPALNVLCELLRQSLLKQLHFDEGIAYYIGADGQFYSDSGFLALLAKAKRSSLKRVEKVMQDQIDQIRKGDIDYQKVEDAKTSLRGKWALAIEGNGGWRHWLESLAFLYTGGEPLPNVPAQIAAVRPEDLTRVVTQYFTLERMCEAVERPLF